MCQDGPVSETADRYRELAARLTDIVEAVPHDRWDDQSPCSDWTALHVLGHLVESQADFLERLDIHDRLLPDDDPRRAWPVLRDGVQGLLDDPAMASTEYESAFGPTTFEQTMGQFFCLDLLVHGWDIARATGLEDHEDMPPEEVERNLAFVRGLGDNARSPGVFGPEVEMPDGADPQTRFPGVHGPPALSLVWAR